MKKLVLIGFLSLSTLISTAPAFAATDPIPTGTCQPIFGGGQTCSNSGNLIVNKTIQSPTDNTFVDSLGPETPLSPNQDVTFHIAIANNNNSAISNVSLTDYFPPYMSLTKGPGTYDVTNRTLTLTIDKIQGNETKNYTITAHLGGSDVFPANQNLTCLANRVVAKAGARQSSDNVQFCVKTSNGPTPSTTTQDSFSYPTPTPIQSGPTPTKTTQATPTPKPSQNTPNTTKGGTPVYPTPTTTSTPGTGPEMLTLIGLLPIGGTGLFLRKKSGMK